jgi:hypothetical protein
MAEPPDDRYPFREDAPDLSPEEMAAELRRLSQLLSAILRHQGGRIVLPATALRREGRFAAVDVAEDGDNIVVTLGEW